MVVAEANQFRDAVESVWSTMLGIDVEPGQAMVLDRGDPDYMTGCIQITGAWQGAVTVDCSVGLARQITALMFGIEVYETMPDQVSDALGEMTNIISGTIKSFLPEPSSLSLPAVAEGRDCYFRVIGARLVAQLCFSYKGEPFQVTIVEGLK
jgi:chemotaxis protein CheX